ncbi:MAG: helix-turn-helix domain-containing protein [Solirubrobacteraceae bacterium]
MVRLLTPQEVAEACQLSARTVVRAIERGDLRASKLAVRGGWRILPADIDGLACGSIEPAPRPTRR